MRAQLIQYVTLLFAGAPDSEEIRQEILQNTLDRYDDLISQGKAPEAAYSLAISGIGDVSELLKNAPSAHAPEFPRQVPTQEIHHEAPPLPLWKKALRIIAIFLYIICIIPLIVLSEMGMDTLGLCATICIVAVATVAILSSGRNRTEPQAGESAAPRTPQDPLRKALHSTITALGLVTYFAISFLTMAWWITWLVFPIMGAVHGLVNACLDLKEVRRNEN